MGNLKETLGSGWNAADHEDTSRDAVPPGEYIVTVDAAELRETKAGNGMGCNVTFEIAEGENVGRKAFNWFNIRHENQEAEQIGQAEFASLCKALGVLAPEDTDELHGKHCRVKIGIDKKSPDKNTVRGFKPVDAPAASPSSGKPSGPAKTSAKKMPWQK